MAASHLGFGFRRLQDKRLGRLIRFLCGLLGVTRVPFHDQLRYSSKMAAILELVFGDL
jgi:hypothetical protein